MGGLRRTGGSQAPTLVPLPICPILPDTLFYFLPSLQYTSYTWQEKVYHRPVKNSRSWQLVTQSVWVGKARKRFRFQTSRLLGFKEGFGTRCLLCEEREKHVGLSAVNHITSLFYFHGYTLWRETGRGQWSYRESSLGGLFRPAFVSRYCLTLSDTTLDRIIPASCSRDTHQI